MNKDLCAVILAAGEGKRMKSEKPKALAPVLFQPILGWVLDAVRAAGIEDICVVTGHKGQYIEDYVRSLGCDIKTVHQDKRLGTGHAVMTAGDFVRAHSEGDVLILNGDAPFIDAHTIRSAADFHRQKNAACTVITAEVGSPAGYGRIVRENGDMLKAIVEEKEASAEQKQIKEINSGAFWFKAASLLRALDKIEPSVITGEYYLTDAVGISRSAGESVCAFCADSADAVLGANDGVQLNALNEIARVQVLEKHMRNGVYIPCRDGVIVGSDVTIGKGVTLLPAVVLKGGTVVGDGCTIGPAVCLENCCVSDGSSVSCVSAENRSL